MAMRSILFWVLFFIPAVAMAGNYCADVNTAGAWKMEETTGDFADCTINASPGVVSGVNMGASGKYNNGARFANVNNAYVNFGSATVLDNLFDGGGTVGVWVSLDSAGTASIYCSGAAILSKGDADGWGLCVNTDGSLVFTSKWAGGNVAWTTTTAPFSGFTSTFKHVLVYYNSSSASNTPSVYADCSALTVTQGAIAPFSTRNTDAAINLAAGIDGLGTTTGEMSGYMDELILYKGDLTGSCSDLANGGLDGSVGGGGGGAVVSGGKVIYGTFYGAI